MAEERNQEKRDVMVDYFNQIHLIEKGVEPNRRFFRLLSSCDELENVAKWFDKLVGGSLRRQIDKSMTLDKFIENIDSDSYIILQIASPNPLNIRYTAKFDRSNTSFFGFVSCPYNEHNLNLFGLMYQETFGHKLEAEPVSKLLLNYHNQIKNNY